jgi:hypothetical protein
MLNIFSGLVVYSAVSDDVFLLNIFPSSPFIVDWKYCKLLTANTTPMMDRIQCILDSIL